MSTVAHHLLQAQCIHNEIRAQRDELAAVFLQVVDTLNTPQNSDAIQRGRRALSRIAAYAKTQGEPQL